MSYEVDLSPVGCARRAARRGAARRRIAREDQAACVTTLWLAPGGGPRTRTPSHLRTPHAPRFAPRSLLGKGFQGEVRAAREVETGCIVAAKLMKLDTRARTEVRRRSTALRAHCLAPAPRASPMVPCPARASAFLSARVEALTLCPLNSARPRARPPRALPAVLAVLRSPARRPRR